MEPLVIAISGGICVGKIIVSKLLSCELKYSHVGFGDYIRAIAKSKYIEQTGG